MLFYCTHRAVCLEFHCCYVNHTCVVIIDRYISLRNSASRSRVCRPVARQQYQTLFCLIWQPTAAIRTVKSSQAARQSGSHRSVHPYVARFLVKHHDVVTRSPDGPCLEANSTPRTAAGAYCPGPLALFLFLLAVVIGDAAKKIATSRHGSTAVQQINDGNHRLSLVADVSIASSSCHAGLEGVPTDRCGVWHSGRRTQTHTKDSVG